MPTVSNNLTKTTNNMNQKLEAIAIRAAADLVALFKDGEPKIMEAWIATEEEAALTDAKPKFKLGLSITFDMDKDIMDTALSFGIKHTLSLNSKIPDPSQPELGAMEGTVTIKTAGTEPVTMTTKQFSDAARKMSGKK